MHARGLRVMSSLTAAESAPLASNPFVGRTRELAELEAAVAQVVAGTGTFVLISERQESARPGSSRSWGGVAVRRQPAAAVSPRRPLILGSAAAGHPGRDGRATCVAVVGRSYSTVRAA